jgi:hypothetical protein
VIVLVPCLSCRLATPAQEDAAALSCQKCGTALPPPAGAAWWMMRDGAQYGPYRIAELADWVVEGRILAKDSIWYQGAPVRLDVGQLPRFGLDRPYEVTIDPDGSRTTTIYHRADLSQPVFISHARADSRFAAVFAHELAHHGLKAWYAERDADPAGDYWAEVDRAIDAAGVVVVVISPALGQAPNVAAEVERARRAGTPVLGLSIAEQPGREHGLGELAEQFSAFGPEAGAQSYMLLFLLADIYGIQPNDARPDRFALNLDYPGEGGTEPYYALPPGPLPAYPAPPGTAPRAAGVAPAAAEEQPTPAPAPAEPDASEAPAPTEAPAPVEPEPAPAAPAAPEPAPVETASGIPPLAETPIPVAPEPAPVAAAAPAPRLIVHIPCLACRVTTPVPEDVAAVSCQRCGTVLPPPTQAAWFMLRDGGQFGPYTTGQLAGYVAERRILPTDSVWYQGAAVRLDVSQLPPFGEVEEQSASAPIAAEAPTPAPVVPPAAASLPADGSDWDSVEVQPGETKLDSWVVSLWSMGIETAGSLTVTDRRLLFKPKFGGRSIVGMVISQTRSFKDESSIILPRERILAVRQERRLLNKYVIVTIAEGDIHFNRGVMSADPILAALQPR